MNSNGIDFIESTTQQFVDIHARESLARRLGRLSCRTPQIRVLFTFVAVASLCALSARQCRAAELKAATVAAFDQYVKTAESRMNQELENGRSFFWIDDLPPAKRDASYARLRKGEVLIRPRAAGLEVPGGMIHDWEGIVFIPNATLDEALAEIQDYENYPRIYAPNIVRSKILQHNGQDFTVSLRLEKKSFTTIDVDVVAAVHYSRLSPSQLCSDSHSIRVTEVDNPGTAQEHENPPGEDHGYIWRMNDYRRIREDSSGVYLQFEAIALSRDIPWGLAWLLRPFVTKLPGESLNLTLLRTRSAIEANARRSHR